MLALRELVNEEYMALVTNDYDDDFILEIGGFVEKSMHLSLKDLREISHGHTQITVHHCVQGFSSIGTWDGLKLLDLLELVKPLDGTTDIIVHSFQDMSRSDDN